MSGTMITTILTAALVGSRDLSTTLVSSSTNVQSAIPSNFNLTCIIAHIGAAPADSSSRPSSSTVTTTETSTLTPALCNIAVSSSFKTAVMPSYPYAYANRSSHRLQPVIYVYYYITVTRLVPNTSLASPSPSFSSVFFFDSQPLLLASTLVVPDKDDIGSPAPDEKPRTLHAVKAWFYIAAQVTDLCYRVLHTLVILYNIRITIKFLGR